MLQKLQTAYDASIRTLNNAAEARGYAGSALIKARAAEAQAKIAVDTLAALLTEVYLLEKNQ